MKNKFKIFFSLEKEEAWLNRQLAKGWVLVASPGDLFYRFKETSEENLVIRLDYHKFATQKDFIAYQQFMEDAGWQLISGNKGSGRQYFLGSKEENQELFSDNPSRFELAKRLRNGKITAMLLCLSYVLLFFRNSFDSSFLFQPQKAFLTPGLWEEKGWHFILSFLWELPFATIRLMVHLGLPVLALLIILVMVEAQWHFYQSKKKFLPFG